MRFFVKSELRKGDDLHILVNAGGHYRLKRKFFEASFQFYSDYNQCKLSIISALRGILKNIKPHLQ